MRCDYPKSQKKDQIAGGKNELPDVEITLLHAKKTAEEVAFYVVGEKTMWQDDEQLQQRQPQHDLFHVEGQGAQSEAPRHQQARRRLCRNHF